MTPAINRLASQLAQDRMDRLAEDKIRYRLFHYCQQAENFARIFRQSPNVREETFKLHAQCEKQVMLASKGITLRCNCQCHEHCLTDEHMANCPQCSYEWDLARKD